MPPLGSVARLIERRKCARRIGIGPARYPVLP
jgi:hypothetical protein